MVSRKEKAAQFIDEGYQISVTGRNVLVTDAMKNYVMDKIAKLERFTNRIIDVNVTLDIQRYDHRCCINFESDNIRIRSQGDSKDMYASIDLAVSKLETQLRRYKRQIHEHQAKTIKSEEMNVNIIKPLYVDELEEINDEIEEANQREYENYRPHEVVDRESRPLKQLTTDEALLKLELSGDNFLIYRSEEDLKIKVMYRRNDGNYGIIEPE